jgi:L-rhamnose mutarotase
VPEDRGVQSLVRPMSVLHNFSLAALGSLSRARLNRPQRRATHGGRGSGSLQRQDELDRGGRRPKALIREKGVRNYSIHLDPETNVLFAYLERSDDHGMDDLTKHPVMQRWWAYMKDIMAANPDGSPVTAPLIEVFHLE